MAKFISFNVKNFYNTNESEPETQFSGEWLLDIDQIVRLRPSGEATSEPMVEIILTNGNSMLVYYSSVLVDEEGEVSSPTNEGQPLSNDYTMKATGAIFDAMTSNPGGARTSVILPEDTDGKQMYWRTYVICTEC
jgi:hypothetical protein